MSDSKNMENIDGKKVFDKRKVKNRVMKKSKKFNREKVKRILFNYCESTAMHGFRYIADDLPILEKYIWFTILVIASIFCVVLMWVSYTSIQSRLPLIQIADRSARLYKINFPAVTICNFNKVYKLAAIPMQNTLMNAGYSNETINSFFRNLSLLVRPGYESFEPDLMNNMLYLLDTNLKNLMRRLMQPCYKLLKSCYWLGKLYDCTLIFKVVDSYHGHCCSFNYAVKNPYADENYSPECEEYFKKYDDNKNIPCNKSSACPGRKKIVRVPGSGIDAGLIVDIDIEEDMYEASTRDFAGAAVLIHVSQDYPETDIATTSVQPDQQTNIAVAATLIKSLDEIRIYSPAERTCIFEDELNFGYSYQSCVAGCKMKRYLQFCDCIPYYYPDTCTNISRTCDMKKINCIKNNLDKLTKIYEDIKINGTLLPKCNCQQTCNKTTYSILVDKNRRNHPSYILPWKTNITYDRAITRLNVFFQDYGFTQYTRSLYMTWDTILANLGGLLGICLGGSLISLMEPIIHVLLIPVRRSHQRSVISNKSQKQSENERDEFESIPSARKFFRSVPVDKKLLKEWKERQNSIFIISDHFNIPSKQRQRQRLSRKQFISEYKNLFL